MITLQEIFNQIRCQQADRGIVQENMTADQKKQYASHCALALHVEVSELASSWAFAPWKTGYTDADNIEREIIDCIFFLVNIAECFSITPAQLETRFNWVLENNQRRIGDGTHKPVKL